jgi:hypothetical protein
VRSVTDQFEAKPTKIKPFVRLDGAYARPNGQMLAAGLYLSPADFRQ